MKKPGRNDPYPWGSGKKYKKCCMNQAQAANEDLRDAMAGENFGSIEEVQTFANQFMQQRNRRQLPEFAGLSPEQMYRLLNKTFESPELISFPDSVSLEDQTPPLYKLFQLIADAATVWPGKASTKFLSG